MISSVGNATIRRARRLRKARGRDRDGAFLVEGWKAVEVGLRTGAPIRELFHTGSCRDRRSALLKAAESAGIPLHEVTQGVMEHLTDSASAPDVLAVAVTPGESARSMIGGAILVGVRDAASAGSIMASVAACGGRTVVFARGSVDPYRPRVVRAARGAHFVLSVTRGLDAAEAAGAARSEGARLVALVDEGPAPWDRDLSSPFTLVVGCEDGDDGILSPGDERVALPTPGAVAPGLGSRAAAVLFEGLRQRGQG
ncbi:MAG: hypothetical protein HY775_06650 [Acidobacteria bacterium]|nr:hypothetical protein [Acidobacteriota bacterium]